MSRICPSKLCNHENPDSSYICGKCGLRLDMNRMEVEGRDKLYTVMKEVVKEIGPKTGFPQQDLDMMQGMSRKDFDEIVGNHVGQIFMVILAFSKDDEPGTKGAKPAKSAPTREEPKIMDPLELEREKLAVLKEIRDSLKGMKKKNG